jgi:hypothetical protein
VTGAWSWVALVALGAYHGLNPAMGWLFAVSQGLQQRDRRAVLRAVPPIAVGHEASVLLVAAVVLAAGAAVGGGPLRIGAAAVLLAFGVFRFVKPRAHFRWTTMRVSARELGLWSFLMATAHGAGLMVAPVLIGAGGVAAAAAHDPVRHTVRSGTPLVADVAGLTLHVLAMVAVMTAVSLLVYSKVGVDVLRRAWINTDLFWAGAFVVAAVLTLLS